MKNDAGNYFRGLQKSVSRNKERGAKRGFFVHLVVYIFVNILLVVINFLYSPKDIWFFYPLIDWGIGISMHYLFGVRWIEKELKEMEAKAEYRARETKKQH